MRTNNLGYVLDARIVSDIVSSMQINFTKIIETLLQTYRCDLSPFVHEFYQRWFSLFLLIILLLWRFLLVPYYKITLPTGTYVAILGSMAALITIWPPEQALSKAFWLVVMSGFMFLEIQSIYSDRKSYEEQRQELQNQFSDLINRQEKLFYHQEGLVTGGDSFCYLIFTPSSPDSWVPLYIHNGKYPLYGVTAEIDDVDNSGFKFSDQLALGDIPAGTGASVEKSMRWNKRHAYLILYWARNGRWVQRLISRKVNGQWVYATRVEKDDGPNKKILLERVPTNFPRNEKGEIDWNVYYQLDEKELSTVKDFSISVYAKFHNKDDSLAYLPILQRWVDDHYQKPGAPKVVMATFPTWDGKWAIPLPPTYPPLTAGQVVNTVEPPH